MKKIFLIITSFVSLACYGQDTVLTASKAAALLLSKTDTGTANAAIAIMATKASVVFSQISTANISTYTVNTDYSLKGIISGNDTLKVADFKQGKTWVGFVDGTYSTPVITVGNVTVKILLGSTVILSQTIGNLPLNIASYPYSSKIQIVCRQTGSSGSVAASGYVEFNTGTSFTSLKLFFTPTVTPVNLTTDKVYNSTVSYSLSGHAITSVTHSLISLN